MFDDDEREQVPTEACEIHQRLLDDSRQWASKLPSDARVTEFARTMPQHLSLPAANSMRNVLAHRRPSSTLPDMMSVKGHTSMLKFQGPKRTLAASFAAVVVVALIAGVLYSANIAHGTRAGSGGGPNNSTVVVPTPEQTPLPTPGPGFQTPGPLAKYISEIVTAGGRSADGPPTNIKSHFVVGDWVYVLAIVRGLPKGLHTISIRWYLNGSAIELPASAQTSQPISGDQRVVFGLVFPTSGIGTAKIFIDRPASDSSESPSDPYLAETITFVVEMPQPTVAPGNSTPTPTPTPFVATPTPHP